MSEAWRGWWKSSVSSTETRAHRARGKEASWGCGDGVCTRDWTERGRVAQISRSGAQRQRSTAMAKLGLVCANGEGSEGMVGSCDG